MGQKSEGGLGGGNVSGGIDPERFEVGAYGSDHEARSELPAIARARVQAARGQNITGEDIVIIGDTPADVDCGRSLGVRAIAVATGHFSVAELEECGAFAVFDDLSDTEAALRELLRGSFGAVDIQIVGSVAVFTARMPTSAS